MFKAIDITTQSPVIILAVRPTEFRALQLKSKEDSLRCPICNQPVWTKARMFGKKRPHFAHKHLANCPSSSDSPELLQARASLYIWIKSKFPSASIEERPPGWEPKRPIDVWVADGDRRFAYWLVDHQMKPPDRLQLAECARAVDAHLNIVFLAGMMRRNGAPQNILNLNTTERNLLKPSKYDLLYRPEFDRGDGSLHYLEHAESGEATIVSFRAMQCIEEPQQFKGFELRTALASLLISRATGEFAHPGEKETVQQRVAQPRTGIPASHQPRKILVKPPPRAQTAPSTLPCRYCGKWVAKWYWRSGDTCKCLDCHSRMQRTSDAVSRIGKRPGSELPGTCRRPCG